VRISGWVRRTVLLAVVLVPLGLTLTPITAAAKPVEVVDQVLHVPFTGSLDNPCTGETVQFDGYFVFHYRVLNISAYTVLVQSIAYATYSVTAVGETTGANYQVMLQSSAVQYEQGANITLTSTFTFQVIGADSHFVTRYAVHLEVVDGNVISEGTFLDPTCI
jgi:hypothetical protein